MIVLGVMTTPASGADSVIEGCITRIAAGQRDALEQLYTQTRPAVYGFALSMVKNSHDAEDLLHDTYVQVWHGAPLYRPNGKPMAWLMTIVRNLATDLFRRRSRSDDRPWEEVADSLAQIPALTQEDRMTLQALLGALSDEERQIVTLHALSGLKHREIALLLQLPLPTVLSKYNRALKKLRLAWKETD